MRTWKSRVVVGITAAWLAVCSGSEVVVFGEEYDPYELLRTAEYVDEVRQRDVQFQLASAMQPAAQVETAQPVEAPSLLNTLNFAPAIRGLEDNAALLEETPTNPPLEEAVSQQDFGLTQVQDTAALLTESNLVQTVSTQRRSPVSMDPYIRGYRHGQIYSVADGAAWMPIRQDLDSMISKLDPSLIDQVIVIPGPYGLRYGPGFSFIDVQTINTPRYCNGFEAHHREAFSVRTNGGQIFGRETVYGGNADYGFILNYGNRTGSDYEAGDGTRIPSSYKYQTLLGQFGFDLTEDSKVEFRYNRLDGTDTEYAAQFFDIDFVVTDAFLLSYIADSPITDSRTRGDMWFNRSRFLGTTRFAGKRGAFPVLDRVEAALADAANLPTGTLARIQDNTYTDGDTTSTGARWMRTYGQDDWVQMTIGSDIRYLEQHLHEEFFLAPPVVANLVYPNDNSLNTNMPRAEMVDPGVFMEWKLPMLAYWDLSIGGRVDFVHTNADASQVRANTSLQPEAELQQQDLLYAFYASNDFDLNENLTTRFGFGHAQRPPNLIERYSDGLFLGLIQSGFSRLIGRPDLRQERSWQADWSWEADYDTVRGRASVYHAWILDYITYEGNVVDVGNPNDGETLGGARLLRTINTDLATLTGFELYGEWDTADWMTVFGTLRYIDGRDRVIDQPLANILPLESRTGVRLRNPNNDVWGIETGMRLVDDQDRLAGIRNVGIGGAQQLEVATPGFTTFYTRGYYNVTRDLSLTAGVENLFDRRYLEHVDLRLPSQTINGRAFSATEVLSPGITPYFGIEWNH